jgi:hypothetical protein
MVDRHVRLVVGAELAEILKRGFTGQVDATGAPPALLYVVADGQQLRDAVRDGAWLAVDARFAGEAALDAYALPLLNAFLDARRSHAAGGPEQEFSDELVRNFSPVGSKFDRYLARLFAAPGPVLGRSHGRRPYALALRTAELDAAPPGATRRRRFELSSAIYDSAVQQAILGAIYTCFESYYANAIERFGSRNAEQVLSTCREAFREAAGDVLPRFRPPALAPEREWIATAPCRAPDQFQLAGNLLVPALALRSHKPGAHALALEHTLVDEALPQPLAAEGLRQFYRAHQLPARIGVAGNDISMWKFDKMES